jgi:hypothetical protein
MFDLIPVSVRNMLDAVFKPPKTFLQLIIDLLDKAGSVTGRGISLNNYFGWFGYLPPSWQLVVKSALASVALLAILFLIRSVWDMYLKAKQSAQWW